MPTADGSQAQGGAALIALNYSRVERRFRLPDAF